MAQRLDPVLEQALRRGAAVLTPGRRAARVLRQTWARHQTTASVFDRAPEILPLEAWLAAEWHRRLLHGQDDRILLNRSQEHILWRETIATDLNQHNPPAEALAETAARAWTLLCRYQGRERLRELAATADTRAFEHWTRAFERRLARERLLTAAQLPAQLAQAPHLDPLSLAIADFDVLQPAVSDLFETLRQNGAEIVAITTASSTQSAQLAICENDAHELQAAALWARAQLTASPGAQLAIVVPNPADRRADIDRVFSRTLAPERMPVTASASDPVLEFSLGRPLAGLPIAQTALDLLTWCFAPLPLERISTLLLSPWFTGSDLHAAEFDAFRLRQAPLLRPELTLDATLQLAGKSFRRLQGAGGLLHRLRTLRKATEAVMLSPTGEPQPRTFGEWSDLFRTLLDAAGWTAHADADSLSFQQHRRFETVLAELATLDLSGSTPSFEEARAALARMLAQAVFAPESLFASDVQNAPVQIIGPLELGAVGFDALWFLGADDLVWPASLQPNPLLPFALQRAHRMPGADRERDDAQAASLTRRIAQSAPEVVFSYALRSDEGLRRPSALLAALALTPVTPATLPAPKPSRFAPAAEDRTLTSLPPERTTGGTSLLALQAACAFRAFAEKRLRSSALDAPQPGFDAMQRGNQVHIVMERLWSDLKTQAALKSLSPARREALLEQSIDHALADGKSAPDTSWDHAYLNVQRKRLADLLRPWLDLETRRPPFTVLPPEQKQQFALGPLTLNLRIDRMDQTDAGGVIVLDYKTGKADPKQWDGPRPDAPQMPLYAVIAHAAGHPLEGVAFALLRAGRDLGLKGFADDPNAFGPGQKPAPMHEPSLTEQVDTWRSVLTALAEAFAAGDTRVAPKQYPKTCTYCDQRLLCRLDPARLAPADPDTEEEEEPTYG